MIRCTGTKAFPADWTYLVGFYFLHLNRPDIFRQHLNETARRTILDNALAPVFPSVDDPDKLPSAPRFPTVSIPHDIPDLRRRFRGFSLDEFCPLRHATRPFFLLLLPHLFFLSVPGGRPRRCILSIIFITVWCVQGPPSLVGYPSACNTLAT